MAKQMNAEKRAKMVSDMRKRHHAELVDLCREIGVCTRCNSAKKELAKNTSVCTGCQTYNKEYVRKRAGAVKKAPAKVTVKSKIVKSAAKVVKKIAKPVKKAKK